jgi:hypothetical protein
MDSAVSVWFVGHPGQMVLGVGLGALFLEMFYRAVQFQWPDSYFAAGDTTAYAISVSPIRYLTFRFLPVYATCLFVDVTLGRNSSSPLLATLLIAALHSIRPIRSFVEGMFASSVLRRHRAPVLVLRLATIGGIFLVSLLAYVSRVKLESLVPSVHDVTTTLWTAAIAGIGGAYVLQVSRGRTSDAAKLAHRSAETISRRLWELAGILAAEHNVDASLVRGIMIAENLQRPRWFRKLEWVKGQIFTQGTYGIMQIASDTPISDEESIRRAVSERLSGQQLIGSDGGVDYTLLTTIAKNWNPDPTFVDLLSAGYFEASQRG